MRAQFVVAGLAGTGSAGGVVVVALPPRILNITVPQVGHVPLIAFLPFFMTSSTAFTISFLALHLTQYPSGIENFPARRIMRQTVNGNTLRFVPPYRQLVKGCLFGPRFHNAII
jgi:hypothetical protein